MTDVAEIRKKLRHCPHACSKAENCPYHRDRWPHILVLLDELEVLQAESFELAALKKKERERLQMGRPA